MIRFLLKAKKTVSLILILSAVLSFAAASESGDYAFIEGCKAFSSGDWENATFMLKKAVSYPAYENADAYYMLISAEVYANDYKAVLNDCDTYLKSFPSSLYYSRVCYLKGRNLFNLGEYDKSIIVLSDFCHQYEKDDMYSFALYYIAEALYADYKYDEAKVIYQRIIDEFPDCEKYTASQFRVETISQRLREEKLLYLLKQTGEEYLAAKEEYEKQLRLYNSDTLSSARLRLQEAQQKNTELEQQIKELEQQIAILKSQQTAAPIPATAETTVKNEVTVPNKEPYSETSERIRQLKKKAQEAQQLLDDK